MQLSDFYRFETLCIKSHRRNEQQPMRISIDGNESAFWLMSRETR